MILIDLSHIVMFDRIIDTDSTLEITILSDPSCSAFQKFSELKKYVPVAVKPIANNLGGKKDTSLLIIPDGVSKFRKGEPSYTVVAINLTDGTIHRRHIDHLPVSRDKNKRRGPPPQPKERLKFLCEALFHTGGHRLGQFYSPEHYDSKDASDISLLFDEKNLADIIHQTLAETAMIGPKRGAVEDFIRAGGQTLIVGDHSEAVAAYKGMIEGMVAGWVRQNIPDFVTDTFKVTPGQQTKELFSFLMYTISNRARKKQKKNTAVAVDVEIVRAARAELIQTYPLLASQIEIIKSKGDLLGRLGKRELDPTNFAKLFWQRDGHEISEATIEGMVGRNEDDIPHRIARTFMDYAQFLAFITSVDQLPNSCEQWEAFADLTKVDRLFSRNYFRPHGQTIMEISADQQDDWVGWRKILCTAAGISRYKTVADTILALARAVGRYRLAPLFLNMIDEGNLCPNIKPTTEEYLKLIAFCDVGFIDSQTQPNAQGMKIIADNGLCPMGIFYRGCSLSDLVFMQRRYVAVAHQHDKWRQETAVRRAISNHGVAQKIEPLPPLPNQLQSQMPKFAIMPVANAGQIHELLTQLNAQQAWEEFFEIIYGPVFFAFVLSAYKGDTAALCVFEDVDPTSKTLKLSFKKIIGANGEHVTDNEISEKIDTYLRHVNGLNLQSQTYKDQIQGTLRNAMWLEGIEAIIGHDRGDPQKNIQAARQMDAISPDP